MTTSGYSWRIGDATITQIFETEAGAILQSGLPEATPDRVAEIAWLQPAFASIDGHLNGVVQAFVVEANNTRTLVDTCVGNGKPRHDLPEWGNLHTDFLDTLGSCGFHPDSIDTVVCTHLHFDHVGWNTTLVNGEWVPTFTRARHLFGQDEFAYWKGMPDREFEDDKAGVRDSVLPVIDAGLSLLVDSDHRVSETISLIPTPGHTPGHLSVKVESGGQVAIITGDVFHHPCQIANPDWASSADYDAESSIRSRLALLEDLVGTDSILIGSHFPSPFGGRVVSAGSSFRLVVGA